MASITYESSSSFNPSTFFVTKKEAQAVFSSLGENRWKQLIDGRFHPHGKMVFDKGLHGHRVEPRFLESANKGMDYACEHLTEPLTVLFYKTLHAILCQHFKESVEQNTLIDAALGGTYRTNAVESTKTEIRGPFTEEEVDRYRETIELYNRLNLPGKTMEVALKESDDAQKKLTEWLKKNEKSDQPPDNGIEALRSAYSEIEKQANRVSDEKIGYASRVQREIDEAKDRIPNVPPFCTIFYQKRKNHFEPYLMTCEYHENEYLGEFVERFLKDYNDEMSKLNLALLDGTIAFKRAQNLKLELIAELFQRLEWLHPFGDGQGRTDLVLLSKLLTEEGFHPAILNHPYVSTNCTLFEWLEYLKLGLEKWRKEAEYQNDQKNQELEQRVRWIQQVRIEGTGAIERSLPPPEKIDREIRSQILRCVAAYDPDGKSTISLAEYFFDRGRALTIEERKCLLVHASRTGYARSAELALSRDLPKELIAGCAEEIVERGSQEHAVKFLELLPPRCIFSAHGHILVAAVKHLHAEVIYWTLAQTPLCVESLQKAIEICSNEGRTAEEAKFRPEPIQRENKIKLEYQAVKLLLEGKLHPRPLNAPSFASSSIPISGAPLAQRKRLKVDDSSDSDSLSPSGKSSVKSGN